jgi:hypothetical protein
MKVCVEMREKLEREGVGKHSSPNLGAVRLTEYEHGRGNGSFKSSIERQRLSSSPTSRRTPRW